MIRDGAYADLILFDLIAVADAATFEGKVQPHAGIADTRINGRSASAHSARHVSRKQKSPC